VAAIVYNHSFIHPVKKCAMCLSSRWCAVFGLALVGLMLAAGSAPISAASTAITADAAWVRQPPPGAEVAGAYLRLHNPGSDDDRLLAVTTAAAERVEIHEMRMDEGIMRMRALAGGLPLPAGASVVLAPGGQHLMLIAPSAPLEVGATLMMTLAFEHAPELTVEFTVRPLVDADAVDDAPPHHQHHHHHTGQ